jgi:MATE family multidrug resistance protein
MANEQERQHISRTEQQKEVFDFWHETKLLANIALPTAIIQFTVYFIYPETASAVGRNLGTEALAGFSLGSLAGNMTCLATMIGVLSAADTLMPRAFGTKHYEQVGILTIQSFVVCFLALLLPVIPLLTSMDWIFEKLGQDPIASDLAASWLRIYVLGVPFVLLFRVLQRFLACQHVVWPMMYGSLLGCLVVHPLLLHIMIPKFGFLGSGVAICLTQMVQVGVVLLYMWWRPVHKAETWSGLSYYAIRQALQIKPMLAFLKLSLGGILALSEWWFWEVVCMLAGHMGVIPLCVHTIAYNLVPICFMIPLGLSIGLSVRMGHVLADSVHKAQILAATCMGVVVILATLLALFLWHLQDPIVALFTKDDEVKSGCKEIWHLVCIYMILLYIFGINGGILRALGKQWTMAAIICVVLWLGALPTLVHFAVYKGGGVQQIWHILPMFYFAMNVLLILSYVTADWHAISASIRERRASQAKEMAESKRLLDREVV